jgi:hypothetical protein
MTLTDRSFFGLESPQKSISRAGVLFFALGLTLADDGFLEFGTEGIGEVVNLIVPVNLDRHFCGIANDIAVMAPVEMFLQLALGGSIDGAIQIIG